MCYRKGYDFKIEHMSLPIQSIVNKISMDQIFLTPRINLPPEQWSDEEISQYFESILINFPIYPFWFSFDQNKYWEIFDGYKRITAFKKFILSNYDEKSFKLKGMKFLTNLNGCTFDKLPISYKKKILERYCKVYMIRYCEPNDIKDEVLRRLGKL